MKFTLKNQKENVYNLMREIGYSFWGENNPPHLKLGFIRQIGNRDYPRFHLYLETDKSSTSITFNLHLDQKKPVYKGAPAHSADYEGPVIEQEAKRIKSCLKTNKGS